MPTIEGKQARIWIDGYVKKAGKLEGVTKAVRSLVKKTVKGSEEYVNPWKIPSFDSNGPLCCFMAGKEHVTFAFLRGAALPDPEKLLEGTGKGVRHVKLRSVADVKRPGVKKLIAEAAKLNRKDPPSGMMVGMEKRKAKNEEKVAKFRVKLRNGLTSSRVATTFATPMRVTFSAIHLYRPQPIDINSPLTKDSGRSR